MNKLFFYLIFVIILFIPPVLSWDNTSGGDHLGLDWTPDNMTNISGVHYNIGAFLIPLGFTIYVDGYQKTASGGNVTIQALSINISGTLDANGRGYGGGGGGANSAVNCSGGFGGINGNGGNAQNASWATCNSLTYGGGGGGGGPNGLQGIGATGTSNSNGANGTLFKGGSGGLGGYGASYPAGTGGTGYGGGGGGGSGYSAAGGAGGGGGSGGRNASWYTGGRGAGLFNGIGGSGSTSSTQTNGTNGGYLGNNTNNDTSADSLVYMGSGGGGSGSSSSGASGGGGGGGGAGGGAITLNATIIQIAGLINTTGSGGGTAGAGTSSTAGAIGFGGGGAGGGVAIIGCNINLTGTFDLRGRQINSLSTTNGGSLKIIFSTLGNSSATFAGRVYVNSTLTNFLACSATLSINYPSSGYYNLPVNYINYTSSNFSAFEKCWYSTNYGVSNSTPAVPGNLFTGLSSNENQNNWTVYCNDTNSTIYSSTTTFIVDTIFPQLTLVNQALAFKTALNYQITASDANGIASFSVNDTTNFNINNSGYLKNNTYLNTGSYWLNITVNDSVNNLASGLLLVNVTPSASINIDLIKPSGNINVTQNKTFIVSVNVSCSSGDCGSVNVTLDPSSGTQYNFTACSATGTTGPTTANCNVSYYTTSLKWLVNVTSGYQNFTVPATGAYTIETWGANGGSSSTVYGGYGAYAKATFQLTQGTNLIILVGQVGTNYTGTWGAGGGGGTFVTNGTNYSSSSLLISAGGGGGYGPTSTDSSNASLNASGRSGTNSNSGTGGQNGSGGSSGSYGGNGGGFLTSGSGSGSSSYNGLGFRQGGTGGTAGAGGNGGFGGGGGGYGGAGGAGGYSGGGGGGWSNGGFGGGAGSNTTTGTNSLINLSTRRGDGLVVITYSSGKGTVNTTTGATPFYANNTNPYSLSLSQGQSQVITWTVNATGTGNYTFFVYANLTSDLSIGNQTNYWNVSIVSFAVDNEPPIVSISNPISNSGQETNVTFSYSVSDESNLTNCSLFINSVLILANTSIIKNVLQTFSKNNLATGLYNWKINCTDVFNNTGTSGFNYFSVVKKSQFARQTTNLSGLDVNNISYFTLDSSYGTINFSDSVNLSSGADIDTYVNISFNYIWIDSPNLPSLNKSAKLKLYNLTYSNPEILKDGSPCSSCVKEDYYLGVLTFNVTSFSLYSARESGTTTPVSGGSSSVQGSSGITKLECKKDTDCKQGYSCFRNTCVKLFDAEILEVQPLVGTLNFSLKYLIKGMADIKGDVIIKFWLQNETDIVELGQDVIYLGSFEEKNKITMLNLPYRIPNEAYNLYLQVEFENYKAQSFRKVNINLPSSMNFEDESSKLARNIFWFIVKIILITLLALSLLIFLARHTIKTHREQEFTEEEIQRRVNAILHPQIKQEVQKKIEEVKEETTKLSSYYEPTAEKIIENKQEEEVSGKLVYNPQGNVVGKIVKRVYVRNQPYGYVIVPHYRFNISKKILIKEAYIQETGDIFIVDEKIERYLKKLAIEGKQDTLDDFR